MVTNPLTPAPQRKLPTLTLRGCVMFGIGTLVAVLGVFAIVQLTTATPYLLFHGPVRKARIEIFDREAGTGVFTEVQDLSAMGTVYNPNQTRLPFSLNDGSCAVFGATGERLSPEEVTKRMIPGGIVTLAAEKPVAVGTFKPVKSSVLIFVPANAQAVNGFPNAFSIAPAQTKPRDDEHSARLRHFLETSGFVAVPMDRLATGYFAVTGAFEQKPVYLLVDTGAPFMDLDPQRVATKGLKVPERQNASDSRARWIDGSPTDWSISTLEVGGLKAGNLMAYAIESDGTTVDSRKMVDGTLGLNALDRYKAIIDVSGRYLYISTGSARPALEQFAESEGFVAVPLRRLRGGYQLVEARLAGKNINLLVDTGALSAGLDPKRIRALGLKTPTYESMPAFPQVTSPDWAVTALEVGGIAAEPIMLSACYLSDLNEGLALRKDPLADGLFGADLMIRYSAILDISANRMFLRKTDRK